MAAAVALRAAANLMRYLRDATTQENAFWLRHRGSTWQTVAVSRVGVLLGALTARLLGVRRVGHSLYVEGQQGVGLAGSLTSVAGAGRGSPNRAGLPRAGLVDLPHSQSRTVIFGVIAGIHTGRWKLGSAPPCLGPTRVNVKVLSGVVKAQWCGGGPWRAGVGRCGPAVLAPGCALCGLRLRGGPRCGRRGCAGWRGPAEGSDSARGAPCAEPCAEPCALAIGSPSPAPRPAPRTGRRKK